MGTTLFEIAVLFDRESFAARSTSAQVQEKAMADDEADEYII